VEEHIQCKLSKAFKNIHLATRSISRSTYNVNCLRHLKIYTWPQEAFQEEKMFPPKRKRKGNLKI
jgi:hypothetical protein